MPTVGEQLRRSREEQALSVYQVSDITKIKTEHVRALEEGDYEVFPAPVYVRGFVRTYARLLKLDAAILLAELDVELGQTEKFRDSPHLAGQRKGPVDLLMLQLSKINWRVALPLAGGVLVVAAAIFGYRAWRTYQSADPLAGLGPGLYQPAQSNSGEVLPLPAPPAKK
ncbi:MAG: helix-turn-helix domain-containing protein [Verrucomicrobia bacterium]|nr:helix-turn-helix domain-containing protein [Verrucomicrobiota bacterium]